MDNCKQIQKMIKDYDKGNLSLKQEEQFIQHILNCEDCKEELEIYYIVSYGLDEDNISKNTPPAIKACIDSYDFKTLVDLKLSLSIDKCNAIREWNHNITILNIMIEVIMLLTLSNVSILKYKFRVTILYYKPGKAFRYYTFAEAELWLIYFIDMGK